MILFEHTDVYGFRHAIHGMRNSWNSWNKSDSIRYNTTDDEGWDHSFVHVGDADLDLMTQLSVCGPSHSKYRRMIAVWVDITAPLYWWKEFDTYKVGTVANSCSTMHTIAAREFRLGDFSCERLLPSAIAHLESTVDHLNACRDGYLQTKDNADKKCMWWQIIQLLPTSYNQKRTVMLNYEVLSNIYANRKNHKLNEWQDFCKWVEGLPHSKIITVTEETH